MSHAVSLRGCMALAAWWQGGRDCFGEMEVPAMFPGHSLGHSHDYAQTAFQKVDGDGGAYEKPLEILSSVNIF